MNLLGLHSRKVGLVISNQEEQYQFIVCELLERNNNLEVVRTIETARLDEIGFLKFNIEIVCGITDSLVVSKQKGSALPIDKAKVLFQEYGNVENYIKKTTFNEIITKLHQHSIFPKYFVLGNKFEQSFTNLVEKSSEGIKFGETVYDKMYEYPLKLALLNVIEEEQVAQQNQNFEIKSSTTYEHALYRNRALKNAKIFVSLLLLVFAICTAGNYLIKRTKNNLLTKRAINQPQINALSKLNQEIEQKQLLLSQNNWEAMSMCSYYLDRIASITPEQMTFNKMEVFSNASKSIEIDGSAENASVLSEFLSSLKLEEFIRASSLEYSYNELSNMKNDDGVFNVSFNIKPIDE